MSQVSNNRPADIYAPDLPWNNYTADQLGPSVMQFVDDHEPYFRRWAQVWFENFQFLFGNQSIKWSNRYGFAVDYDFLGRRGPFNMRVNTNLARVISEALSSFIFGNMPEWDVNTMDQASSKGKRFQKITQRLLEAYSERLLMEKEFQAAAMIYVLYGQVGCEIDWSPLAGKIMEIPRFKRSDVPIFTTGMSPNPALGGLIETPVPMLDQYGIPTTQNRWEPVIDAMGRQIIDRMFAGDISINMLTPFEYRRELGKYGMHKTRYVQRFKLMDYDEFFETYKNTPGATEKFKKIRPVYYDSTVYNMAIRHFMRMQFTTAPSLEDTYLRQQSIFRSSLFKYKVFVVEHTDRPHSTKWPEGRKVIVANGDCTHITKPSYNTNKLDGWHNLCEAQWISAAPSSIAAGPLNDVIRKNKEVNVKDSLVATAVRRNMGSALLIKTGSGLDPQQLTGEPGLTHEVTDVDGFRWLHDDQPIPPVLARFRELDKEDIYESSGAMDALRGEPSSNATSGYQEKQQEEREQKRLTPARKAFEGFVSGIGEKSIACLKANVIKLDDYVMGFLKKSAAGDFSTDDVVAFLSTSIDFGIDIKVIPSSMAVKSRASHQATLQELGQGALAPRLAADADVLDRYLKEFDAEEFRDASSAHRDRADKENQVFMDMLRLGPDMEGAAAPEVIFEDDDNIHLAKHDKFIVENFDEFKANQQAIFEFLKHKEEHRTNLKIKLGEIMPGATQQVGAMMAMAQQNSQPTLQQIAIDTQARAQAEQSRESSNPQAPRQPSGPENKAGTIDPNAPSENTPSAAQQGGIQ